MLLVNCLPSNAEGFGDSWPAPTFPHRSLDLGVLQPVGQASQRDYRGKAIGYVFHLRYLDLFLTHVSNFS